MLRHMRNLRTVTHRRAAVLVLVVLLLPVLLLFCGFAVDVAYYQLARAQLRLAVDAAARAAATELARTESFDDARDKAVAVAAANFVAGRPVVLQPGDIVFGRSMPGPGGKWQFVADAAPSNSVRVNGIRDSSRADGQVPMFFGSLLGRTGLDANIASTAAFRNVDICLVLDRSSSMKLSTTDLALSLSTSNPRFCSPPYADSRWKALTDAVAVFVDELNGTPGDERVALVTFGAELPGLCGLRPDSTIDISLQSNLSQINVEMADLMASVWNGNTHIAAGLSDGIDTVKFGPNGRNLAEKVVLLLTDGNATHGDTIGQAERAASEGVIVHTITFSDAAGQGPMQDVANATGGMHHHATTAAELAEVFRELAAQLAIMVE
jgi:Ca-activated chloride channel homolog